MKRLLILFLMLSIGMVSYTFAQQKLPNIYVLATGGTIAGVGGSNVGTAYKAGQVEIATLLQAVPEIEKIANVKGEQLVKIGSQDMTDQVWLTLAARINTLLKSDDVDGIVITHGTDTMEETAYFLNLTIKSNKPVVLVGAMRPSTSKSADGPLNLYNAVVTAASKDTYNKGVVVVMNDAIWGARDVVKSNTSSVNTFMAPNAGPLGYVANGNVDYLMQSVKRHTTNSIFDVTNLKALPKVGIAYGYSNVESTAVESMIQKKYAGIVYAGVGNGNIHANVFPALIKASQKGITVVRSSRLFSGNVTQAGEVDDKKYGFIASEWMSPQKSRILLMLALTITKDSDEIQKFFEQY